MMQLFYNKIILTNLKIQFITNKKKKYYKNNNKIYIHKILKMNKRKRIFLNVIYIIFLYINIFIYNDN